jgi:hypothetical protein
MKVKKMWAATDEQRHRLRLARKPQEYITEGKRKFSREQLLAYLRDNKFTSRSKLRKGRKAGEPAGHDYVKEFGNWENARSDAFGMKPIDFGFDAKYLTQCVVEYNLWTQKKYMETRKIDPATFPCLRKVRKKWGSFSNLIGSARKLSFKKEIDAYGRLCRKLGRTATLEEARLDGVILDRAVAFYKGKHELDKLMVLWKESDEGKA